MQVNYPELIAALSREDKITFYTLLARNLTITNRAVWSDPGLDAPEQVARMKWLNEVSHRVLNRLVDLMQNGTTWTETDLWNLITHHAAQHPAIGAEIGFAIEHSYAALLKMRQTSEYEQE